MRKLRLFGLDAITLALLLASLALGLFHLHHAQWFNYTNDAYEHRLYIEYIAQHHTIPKSYTEAAYRHPPTYYLLAAGAYIAGNVIAGEEGALVVARLLSMAFYAIFLIYAVLTLQRVAGRGAGYYAALLLVAFWPVGLTLGARITPDILMYACIMGAVYHLVRWQERFGHEQLAASLGFVAGGLLVKNSMLPWVPLIGFLIPAGLVCRYFTLASLKRRDLLLGVIAVAGAGFSTFLRGNMMKYGSSERAEFHQVNAAPLSSLLRFDPVYFLCTSIHEGLRYFTDVLFFNLFLRSLAFDQFVWESELFTLLTAVAMLAVLLYLFINVPWMLIRHRETRRVALLLLYIIGAMTLLLIVTFATWRHLHYANARYIYVIVPLLAALYGLVLRWHIQEKRALLACLGGALALAFSAFSAVLLLAQHVKWLRLDIAN